MTAFNKELIGKWAIRTEVRKEANKETVDDSFMTHPVKILEISQERIKIQMPEQGYVDAGKVYDIQKNFMDQHWIDYAFLMACITPEGMAFFKEENPLIGEMCIRVKPTVLGDYGMMKEPCKILAMTDSHVICQRKNRAEFSIFGKAFADGAWIKVEELNRFAEKDHIERMKPLNPLLGSWCVRTKPTKKGAIDFTDQAVRVLAVVDSIMVVERNPFSWETEGLRREILSDEYIDENWVVVNR